MANTSILEAFKRMWQHVVECMEPKNKLIKLDANSEDAALLLEDKMSYIIENPGGRLDLVWPLYGDTVGVSNCHIRIVRPVDETTESGTHDVAVNFKVKQMVDGEVASGLKLDVVMPDNSWDVRQRTDDGGFAGNAYVYPFSSYQCPYGDADDVRYQSSLQCVDININSIYGVDVKFMIEDGHALLTEDIIDNFLSPATE